MVKYEDLTPKERDRFVRMVLSDKDIESATKIFLKRHPKASADEILKFCFKIAINKFIPKHLKKN